MLDIERYIQFDYSSDFIPPPKNWPSSTEIKESLRGSEPLSIYERWQQVNSELLANVSEAAFAIETQLKRETLLSHYHSDNPIRVLIGDSSSAALITGLNQAIPLTTREFQYFVWVEPNNVKEIVKELVRREGDFLGQGQLLQDFLEDVEAEVLQYSQMIGTNCVGLRLVLENGSWLRGLLSTSRDLQEEQFIDQIVDWFEHNLIVSPFKFHVDEFSVNWTKQYYGATTICVDSSQLRSPERDDIDEAWIKVVQGDDCSYYSHTAQSLREGNLSAAYIVLRSVFRSMWLHQLTLNGIGKPGAQTYQFEPNRSHVYFGAQDKLKPSKILEHARPMIWVPEPETRRFLLLLEPPDGFDEVKFFSE